MLNRNYFIYPSLYPPTEYCQALYLYVIAYLYNSLSPNTEKVFYLLCFIILFLLTQKKCQALDLYEKVFYHLDLIETDYFGLQFNDTNNVSVSIFV